MSIFNRLPSGYQEVEYISSSGTQYINTEVIPTINTGINIDYSYNTISSSVSAGISGIYQPSSPRTDTLFVTSNSGKTNSTIMLISKGKSIDANIVPTANTIYNAKINWLNSKELNFNNGQTTGAEGSNNIVAHEIRLFCREYNNSFSYTSARIYRCKFSEGENIIRDLIPCYRKSDDEIGMYDIVNDVFYTNQGTGEFTKGNDIESVKAISFSKLPTEYQEVEYLESSGTQYIDIGRVPNMDDIVEQKFKSLNTNNNNTIAWYGSMPSSSSTTPRFSIGLYRLGFFVGANSTNVIGNFDNNIHTIKWQAISKTQLSYTYDGVNNIITPEANQYIPTVNLASYLFARHGTDGVQTYDGAGTRIYYHREYLANNTLVRDLVPCYRKNDEEPGMYDLANNVFYTNQGTGAFTVGKEVKKVKQIEDTDGNIWWKKPRELPSEYTQVDYISSNGSQYINTGITSITKEFNIEMDFKITTSQSFQALWCCRTHNVDVTRTCFVTGLTGFRNDQGAQYTISNALSLNQKYNIESTKTQLLLDETVIKNNIATTNNAINDKLWLFAAYAVGTSNPSNQFYGKLYGCKIWDSGNLIREFIPCYRNSDSVAGLYDFVNNVFYVSAGSSDFSYGND